MSTAVRQVDRVRPGDHLCLAFDTDDEQREVLTAFLVAGLARGEKVVYFTDTTAPEMVLGWLLARNIDGDLARARGQLEIRAAQDVYVTVGRFDPATTVGALDHLVAQAQSAGFTGLRISAEMSWALRGHGGANELARFEQQIQQVHDIRGLVALCQYDRRVFGSAAADGMCQLHPLRIEATPLHEDEALRLTPMFDPPGLRVAGTIDLATSPALAAALQEYAVRQAGDVYVDMSDLAFIDVSGLRVLVETAADLATRRLHVLNLAPGLRRVVRLVGWDTAPGLVFSPEVVNV